MDESLQNLKKKTDEKYNDLRRSKIEVSRLLQELNAALNKKSYSNAQRIEDKLAHARSKLKAVEKEYEEAQRREFGGWAPSSQERNDA